MSFRDLYGLPPKASKRCLLCKTEHKGRCPGLRNRRHRKATRAKIERYSRLYYERKRASLAKWWIKKLGGFVDEARRST